MNKKLLFTLLILIAVFSLPLDLFAQTKTNNPTDVEFFPNETQLLEALKRVKPPIFTDDIMQKDTLAYRKLKWFLSIAPNEIYTLMKWENSGFVKDEYNNSIMIEIKGVELKRAILLIYATNIYKNLNTLDTESRNQIIRAFFQNSNDKNFNPNQQRTSEDKELFKGRFDKANGYYAGFETIYGAFDESPETIKKEAVFIIKPQIETKRTIHFNFKQGDKVSIVATGQIKIGSFAGYSTPDGISGFESYSY